MPVDMLVPLWNLPDSSHVLAKVSPKGIDVRRARPREMEPLARWVGQSFSEGWACECRVALCRMPPCCLVATSGGDFVGFACFDVTQRGVFGPMGVQEAWRKMGIGSALLILSLHCMAQMGYKYAVIGEVGPVEFYQRVVQAKVIGEAPGV